MNCTSPSCTSRVSTPCRLTAWPTACGKTGVSRWRCFSREWIRDTKGDSLDISWIKDSDSVDAANLPEPDVLAAEAMSELTEALRELDGLMSALGKADEADAQKTMLAEVLGLSDEVGNE